MSLKNDACLALKAGHAGPHDLVNQQQVAGDHRAGVDHLAFNAVGVVDTQAGGQAGLTRITVHPNLEIGYSFFTWTYHG